MKGYPGLPATPTSSSPAREGWSRRRGRSTSSSAHRCSGARQAVWPRSGPNQGSRVFGSPRLGPGRQLVSRSWVSFNPRPSSAARAASRLPRLSVSLLIRKLPLELKYAAQMSLLNSSPRCDSLVLVAPQSHSEAAYGDINISANYEVLAAQNSPVPWGPARSRLTAEESGARPPGQGGAQLAPVRQCSALR